MITQKDLKLNLRVKNGIVGFDDFWYNCQISSELSVLTSNFPEMKDKIYLYNNFYTYNVEKHTTDSKVDFLALKSENNFNYANAFCTKYRSTTHDVNEIVKDMKRRLWKKEYMYVGVDLYHLLPGTFCYHKFHWKHYTFVTGYDIFKREFYVLEHTLAHGYRDYAIPEDRLKLAIKSGALETKYFVNEIKKDFTYKEYTVEELAEQAQKKVDNLKEMINTNYTFYLMTDYDYSEEYFMDLGCQELFVIMNHMKSNKKLFEQLFNRDLFFSESSYQRMCGICDELVHGWDCAKISLYKIYKTKPGRDRNLLSFNLYIKGLFDMECQMWEMFMRNVKVMPVGGNE